MSSLSTMTVSQLSVLSNTPVVHPTGERKSKLTAIARMASLVALKEALVAGGFKKKAERKSKNLASAENSHSRLTRKNFTFRRLKFRCSDRHAVGTNGHFLRVAIHKETRKVSKVYEKNWTEQGNKLYKQLYPNDVDYKKTLSPVEKMALKAKQAFDREMARRAKVEEEWAAKYGRSFKDFQNYLAEARTDVDDDEEEIVADGLVC